MVFKTRLSKKTCFFIGKCFRSALKLHRACISTKKRHFRVVDFSLNGGSYRVRTYDLPHVKRMLSQLS